MVLLHFEFNLDSNIDDEPANELVPSAKYH